jgi:hypothetical protein
MSSSLTIGTTTFGSEPEYAAAGLELDELELDLETYDRLEFTEHVSVIQRTYSPGEQVALTVDGRTEPTFSGEIVNFRPEFRPEWGWCTRYTALGLKWKANRIKVTHPNELTGSVTYNKPFLDDPLLIDETGLTVGEMMGRVLDAHADALSEQGIAGYVAADLDLLTITPPDPVTFEGMLMDAIDGVLGEWQRLFVCRIRWQASTSDWRVRFENPHEYPEVTLTFGDDPIDPETFRYQEDASNCFTRVVVRGAGEVEGAVLSVRDGTLAPAWDSGDQADWTIFDFEEPTGHFSEGSIVSVSATEATLDPTDAAEEWDADQWDGGEVHLINPIGTLASAFEVKRVSGNDSLAGGGSAIVRWVNDLPVNTPTGKTKYKLFKRPDAALFNVWVRYDVIPEHVRDHMTTRFPFGFSWANFGTLAGIHFPASQILWSNDHSTYYVSASALASSPALFEIDRENGQLVYRRPTAETAGSNGRDALEEGGDAVTPPYDVLAAIPYIKDALEISCPAQSGGYAYDDPLGNNYDGTGFDWYGIEQTYIHDVKTWFDRRDESRMYQLACMILDSLKDVAIDGGVTYLGKWDEGLDFQCRINFAGETAGAPFTTDLETIRCPVRSVNLIWQNGPEPTPFVTAISFNNRRQIATGENLYAPVAFGMDPRGGGYGGGFGGGGFGSFDIGGQPDILLDTRGHDPIMAGTLGMIRGGPNLPNLGSAGVDLSRGIGISNVPGIAPLGPGGVDLTAPRSGFDTLGATASMYAQNWRPESTGAFGTEGPPLAGAGSRGMEGPPLAGAGSASLMGPPVAGSGSIMAGPPLAGMGGVTADNPARLAELRSEFNRPAPTEARSRADRMIAREWQEEERRRRQRSPFDTFQIDTAGGG